MPTLAACYCALHRLPPERFAAHCLPRVLYPHARLARPFVSAVYPDFFDADLELLRAVGALRSPRAFSACCAEYRLRLAHASLTRRHFRLRLSLRRLHRLVAELTAPAQTAGSDRACPPDSRPARRLRRQLSLDRT